MDKKNTMLLTVIAVATLLVAVVGATFAYFTVSQSEAQQTVVTGNVGGDKIGTITLTGGQPLKLGVSAAEMAITAKGTSYYTVEADSDSENTSKLANVVKSTYTATLVDAEDATGSYTCTWKFNVTATGTMTEALNAGDIDFVVNNNGAETVHKLNSKDDFAVLEGTWSGIKGNGTSRYLSAYVVLHNTEDPAGQNSLAGTNLELTITPAEFICSPE